MPTSLRILILEDDSFDAELEIATLEEAGYTCRWKRVETRDDFLAGLAAPDYDLILADYNLPAFDGLSALKLHQEHNLDIPFILVSGTTGEETAIESLKAGATDYVLKDRLSRLEPVVKRALLEQETRQGRRRAEASLRILSRAVEQSPNLVIMTDTGGNIEYVNPKFTQVTGYTPAEVIGQNPRILKSDQIPPAEYKRLWQTITSGGEWHGDFYNRKKNGEFFWASTSISAIRNSRGNITHFLAIEEDITEHKQAEEALRENELRFRATFEQAAVGIAHVRPDGRWLRVNQKLCDIVGYSREELLEQTFQDITHPDDLNSDLEKVRQVLAGQIQTYSLEKRYLHKDGNSIWINLTVSLVRNSSGEPDYFISVVEDITQRKELEEQYYQAQKMDAIGQLTAGIAHDFNNLLTAINGTAELMKMELRPEDPLYAMADTVVHSGSRAADLIRQLLIFSRRQIMTPQIVELSETIREMSQLLERIISENIEINLNLAVNLWPVKVDPAQIEQVVVNLVVNARDAMPAGGKLILETANVVLDEAYTTGHSKVLPGEYVLLAISDTGTGMSQEVQSRLFEPFFTTKGVGKGTGLGLATVYGIVKQSGGHIWVYSEIGQGSIFKVYLPRSTEFVAPSLPPPPAKALTRGQGTILVVEDDAAIRMLARDVLKKQGYTLLEAENGERALRVADNHAGSIHLLLTDVIMPGMSGKALAKEMVGRYPQLKVIFMSGYNDEVISHHGMLEPGLTLLQKPFSFIEMARKVQEILG